MLQRIRDGSSGPLAYVVVGLITLVFGVWGIGSYFTPSSDPVVASAAGTDITHSQLQNAFNQRYQRLRQMLGDNFDPDLMPPDKIRRNVLDGLIDRAVTQAHAQDAGYRVTDANLLAQIRSNPKFQDDGKFSSERYRALLSQANIAPAQYEARLKRELLRQQLQRTVAAGAFATPAQVDQAYKLAHQQRDTDYLVFDPAGFRNSVQVSSAQVEAYYDEHGDQFQRPRRVKLSYVSLDKNDLSVAAPSDKTLHSLYEQHKSDLGSPETRSVDMVSVPINGQDGADARKAIQTVASALDQGQSLAQAAKATPGASLESMQDQPRSALPESLAAPVFTLDKGETSTPVRGDKAWYLARVSAITAAETPDFDKPEVQARLKSMAQQKAKADAYKAKAKQFGDLAYQAPNDLQTIADKLDLGIQHSDWINADTGAGIGQYDAVRKAAFSDPVFMDKLNSEVIDLGEQRKIVLRVADKQSAQRRPLAEVRDDIQGRLVAQQASSKAQDAAHAALDKAQDGATLASIAQDNAHVALESPGFIGRSDNQVDSRVVDAVFSMTLPDDKKASYQVAPMSNGDVALVALAGARDGKADDDKAAQQRAQLARQQSQANAQLEYAALDAYLRDQADVDIQKNALN